MKESKHNLEVTSHCEQLAKFQGYKSQKILQSHLIECQVMSAKGLKNKETKKKIWNIYQVEC